MGSSPPAPRTAASTCSTSAGPSCKSSSMAATRQRGSRTADNTWPICRNTVNMMCPCVMARRARHCFSMSVLGDSFAHTTQCTRVSASTIVGGTNAPSGPVGCRRSVKRSTPCPAPTPAPPASLSSSDSDMVVAATCCGFRGLAGSRQAPATWT